jgi:hypothetical protein
MYRRCAWNPAKAYTVRLDKAGARAAMLSQLGTVRTTVHHIHVTARRFTREGAEGVAILKEANETREEAYDILRFRLFTADSEHGPQVFHALEGMPEQSSTASSMTEFLMSLLFLMMPMTLRGHSEEGTTLETFGELGGAAVIRALGLR